jgi:putative ABC transport system permease protein
MPVTTRACLHLFRLALHLYPAQFRDEYRHELLLVFVDRLRAERGGSRRLVTSLAALGGILAHAPVEHARLLGHDLAYAKRLLWRDAWFTAVSVTTIAVGIGATCAVFSVSKSLLIDALPYRQPDRLVMIWVSNPRQGFDRDFTSLPRLLDWRAGSRFIESFAAFAPWRFELTRTGDPESLRGARVTGNLFDVLRAQPHLGRLLRPADDASPMAVISHDLWQRRFGRDPGVLGRTLILDGLGHTIVGVLPPAFGFPDQNLDVWIPLQPGPSERGLRSTFWLRTVARLNPGVTVKQAQTEMRALASRLARTRTEDRDLGVTVVGLQHDLTAALRPTLLMLTAAVLGVLLIACANVAALLTGRGVARRREIAIRTALGAGRWRVVRQLMTEAVVLFTAGGAGGLLVGSLGLRWLVLSAPPHLLQLQHVSLDAGMVLFTLSLSLVTGLAFGLVPAWATTRPDVTEALAGGDKGSTRGALSQRFRAALVVGQVAIATFVLSVSALLVGSLVRLQQVDLGFEPRGVLAIGLDLPKQRYRQPGARARFFEQLVARVGALPGVESAGAGSSVLLGSFPNSGNFTIEGRDTNLPLLTDDAVTPGFFHALRVPLVRGRPLTAADCDACAPVALINETAARRYWGGSDPIGTRFKFGGRDSADSWTTVVGIVADTRRAGWDREPFAESYRPHAQAAALRRPQAGGSMSLIVRTEGEPAGMVRAIKAVVGSLDPSLPLVDAARLDNLIAGRTAGPRFNAWVLSFFSTVAVVLTTVGLYGLLAYLVILRRRELAVRLALGASMRRIVSLVMLQGLRISAVGVVIGIGSASLASQSVRHLLVGVSASDPSNYLLVVGVVAAATLVAALVPARRAVRVDPMAALRPE